MKFSQDDTETQRLLRNDKLEFAKSASEAAVESFKRIKYGNSIPQLFVIDGKCNGVSAYIESFDKEAVREALKDCPIKNPYAFLLFADSYFASTQGKEDVDKLMALLNKVSMRDIFEGKAGYKNARLVTESVQVILFTEEKTVVITNPYVYSPVDGYEFSDNKTIMDTSESETDITGKAVHSFEDLKEMCNAN